MKNKFLISFVIFSFFAQSKTVAMPELFKYEKIYALDGEKISRTSIGAKILIGIIGLTCVGLVIKKMLNDRNNKNSKSPKSGFESEEYFFNGVKIVLEKGDIVDKFSGQDNSAIVNAANKELAGGAGVCGSIFKAAGNNLQEECDKHGGCPSGQARLTSGCSLEPVKIIHAVGPTKVDPKALESAYQNSLLLAEQNGIKRIAFPAISTGIYGYTKESATPVAINTVLNYLEAGNRVLEEVVFMAFDDSYFKLYKGLLEKDKRLSTD